MIIALTYDLRKDYIARGFNEEDVAEFDSEATINAIDKTIRSLGYTTVRIGNAWELVGRLAKGERWDLVFNICEGLYGRSREAQVPAICELYSVRYTFSDPLVCAVTLDKAVCKRIVRDHGLYTAGFEVIRRMAELKDVRLSYPLFAKPIAEGTGKGITNSSRITEPGRLEKVVSDMLARYRQPVLLEEFLPGREFTTGILGTGEKARVLGTMEVEIVDKSAGSIYSYENKELCESLCKYHKATGAIVSEVEELALNAHCVLQCRDASRVDIRCDAAGRPCFMEVNTLAGLHPLHSDLPIIATQQKMPYNELLKIIIDSALSRPEKAQM
jgi:D-alanine-D-alanine ligase